MSIPFLSSVTLVALTSLALPSTGLAQNYFVDSQATGSGAGTSWQDAFTTIDAALAIAVANDEIWVGDSLILRQGASAKPLIVPSGVSLVGGFWVGATNRVAQRGRTTVLATSPTRMFELAADCVLEGFEILGGQSSTGGAGIWVRGPRVEIRKCALSANSNTTGNGSDILIDAGVTGQSTRTKIINCSFRGGTLTPSQRSAHSAAVKGSNVLFMNCTFSAVTHSGLFLSNNSQVEIVNCLFLAAGRYGLEVSSGSTSFSLAHCSFRDNLLVMGSVFDKGVTVSTLAGLNALPGPGNHVLGGLTLDLGMAHPDLPQFDGLHALRNIDGDRNGQTQPDIGPGELGFVARGRTHFVAPGGRISFGLQGLVVSQPLFALSLGTAPGITLPPLGELLLATQTLIAFTLPGSNTVTIPSTAPLGLHFYTQLVSVSGVSGAFSGVEEFIIR